MSGCTSKKQFDLTNVPTTDKYKENQIKYGYKKQAGREKKAGKRILNDQIELDVYVPDFTIQKGNDVCNFYNEYYKTLANEDHDGRATITINIWSGSPGNDRICRNIRINIIKAA